MEIYILFMYIFLWNQISLDGELLSHPPVAVLCDMQLGYACPAEAEGFYYLHYFCACTQL